MADRTLPRLREQVYTVADPTAIPNQWALFVDAGALRCELYRDGEFLDLQRASLGDYSGGVATGGATLIESDAVGEEIPGRVGAGSFTWSSETGVYVWDVEGALVYSYALAEGIRATTPLYSDRYLFWFEGPVVATFVGVGNYDSEVRLMRANADLTGVTELETWTFNTGAGASGAPPVGVRTPRLTATRLMFSFVKVDDGDGEFFDTRVDRTGANTADRTATWLAAHGVGAGDTYNNPGSAAALDGDCLYAIEPVTDAPSEVQLWRQTDPTAAPSEVWPEITEENANAWAVSDIRSLGLFDSTAQIYGGTGPKLVRANYEGTIDTLPTVSVEVELDGGGNSPTAMFYRGDLI